ncbi:MAG: class I SAM-dependent methyltransferase [Solobacterium sp.]|nr:class I SAM-dependent methyltransferase [Solobacterium sp.]
MNQRIRAIAGMVEPGCILADIGTDHGQLPIFLVKEQIIEKAYACDIAAGPLSAARENIEKEGLSSKITVILSDGFENVPDDADCAVIAGMGFYTARDIVEKADMDHYREIIIQVNGDLNLLRQWISDHHWTIRDEVLVSDRGFDYIAVKITFDYHEAYSEQQIWCGPVLMEKSEDEYIAYCRKQIRRLDDLMMKRNREDDVQKRLRQQSQLWSAAAIGRKV